MISISVNAPIPSLIFIGSFCMQIYPVLQERCWILYRYGMSAQISHTHARTHTHHTHTPHTHHTHTHTPHTHTHRQTDRHTHTHTTHTTNTPHTHTTHTHHTHTPHTHTHTHAHTHTPHTHTSVSARDAALRNKDTLIGALICGTVEGVWRISLHSHRETETLYLMSLTGMFTKQHTLTTHIHYC